MKRIFALLFAFAMVFSLVAINAVAADGDVAYSQGASADRVLVANSAATSGDLAVVGVPFNEGIKAYFEMINQGGGVDGRIIEFTHIDDAFDPVKGKAALENLVEDEEIFAIVGGFGTPVIAAIIEDLKAYGIPSVYFATGITQLHANNAKTNEEGYNIFPVQPLYETEGRLLTAYATGLFAAKKLGVLYTNDDAGMNLLKGIEAQAADIGDIEIVAEQITAGSADVSSAVTTIKGADVDMVIVASIQATYPTIVKELAAQGVNKDAISTYVNSDLAMSTAVVEHIAGKFDVFGTAWVDAGDADAMTVFTEWIPEDYKANAYAMAGWIAGATFVEGLNRIEGQDITWENYMRALEEAPIKLPFGAAVDYADGNRWGTQAMSLSKIVPVSDTAPLGWEPVAPITSITDLLN